MMACYRKIDPRMWRDPKFRALGFDGGRVWQLLITGPQTTNFPGIYSAGLMGLAEDCGMLPESFQKAFRKVLESGMARYDETGWIVWIPKAVEYDPPQSPNVVTSWATWWNGFHDCPLLIEIYQYLDSYFANLPGAFRESFSKAFQKPAESFSKAFQKPAESFSKAFRNPSPSPSPSPSPKTKHARARADISFPDLQEEKQTREPPAAPEPARQRSRAVARGGPPHVEPSPTDIDTVLACYREHHPDAYPNPAPWSSPCTEIAGRMREGYSVEQLCDAVRGCHISPFHAGEHPTGTRYQQLGRHILRDAEQVQMHIDTWARRDQPVLSPEVKRGLRAGRSWVERKREQLLAKDTSARVVGATPANDGDDENG